MSARAGLALLLLSGCVFDDVGLEGDQRGIVGGESHSGDPAVALLDLGDGLCTGTLISPRVILTAAHCLSGPASDISAHFINSIGETGEVIDATRSAIKEGADLGVVALASPASMPPVPANPFPLDEAIGQPVRIVGFGVTSEDGSDSGVKRLGTASLESLDGGEMYTSNDPQGTCYGDSGGPNFMSFDGIEYVAGVTSRGTSICGDGLDIAVRTDSHIAFVHDFIDEVDPRDPDIEDEPDETDTSVDNLAGGCSAPGGGGGAGGGALVVLVALCAAQSRRPEAR